MFLQKNIVKLQLEPCPTCHKYEYNNSYCSDVCEEHEPNAWPKKYNHFKVDGKWFRINRHEHVNVLLSLIGVDDAVTSVGIHWPKVQSIKNLSQFLAFLKMHNVLEAAIEPLFPSGKVKSMQGRALKEMIKLA